jgi:hypothetical protein
MRRSLALPCKCVLFLCLLITTANAQDKPTVPKKEIKPLSVYDLSGIEGGYLLPRLTHTDMMSISDPLPGLTIYNLTYKSLYQYNDKEKLWVPMNFISTSESLASDSCEWIYDSTTHRVYLCRGLAVGDTIFYSVDKRKFIFADDRFYTNSLGQTFPVDTFPGKYYFKSTASLNPDTANANGNTVNIFNEVDNDGLSAAYGALNAVTVANPEATQKIAQLTAGNFTVIHAGQDSADFIRAINAASTANGNGYVTSLAGFQLSTRMLDSLNSDVGTFAGIRNSLVRFPGSYNSKVTGNLYGYLGSMGGFDSAVNGRAYGIFLANVAGAGPQRNYAFYSNKGLNRFGDSVLVTDGFTINPRAVLDINSTSAMILPVGSTVQRPATGITGMFRYNNNLLAPEFYDGAVWQLLAKGANEWVFDATTNRINLVRALPLHDTIFYSTAERKFVFSDRFTNTNSLGQDFPVTAFNGKYNFKSTASQRTDSLLRNGANMNILYEVDNTPDVSVYTNMQVATVVNPKAFQKGDLLMGINNQSIHAGNDSVQNVVGISNTARNSGFGDAGLLDGIQNSVRIQNGSGNNAGSMTGIRNILSISGPTAGRVTGNVYGILQSFSGFTGKVDGNIYGIFINSVTGAAAKKNYAYYSNKGHNRFGDSTVITEGGAISPRAVFDVNSTTAMIVPTGTTAQRPATAVTGMLRYNTSNQTVEAYSGTQWNGIFRGLLSIDIPNIPPAQGTTMLVTVTGATTGSAVSVSPELALSNGIVIAWARVSAANTVEIRFENNANSATNPPPVNFIFRIIQ